MYSFLTQRKANGDKDREIRELVYTLTRRGDMALWWFLHALRKTGQGSIADHFQEQDSTGSLRQVCVCKAVAVLLSFYTTLDIYLPCNLIIQ